MPIQDDIKIISVTLIDLKVLYIQFNIEWTMDDTAKLMEKILVLTSMEIIEVAQGADLQTARFKLGSYEFLLNFEEYSHSCWFECITDFDREGLLLIQKTIEQG